MAYFEPDSPEAYGVDGYDPTLKENCEHVLDDVVGYGIHCVKCGYKPANKGG